MGALSCSARIGPSAEKRDDIAASHCQYLPCFRTKGIAHLGTAGDCCTARFRSGLRRGWV